MYDFIHAPDRADSGASKWRMMQKSNPNVPKGIVPLSVADMEFYNAPEIIEGLQRYLDSHVLGYTEATDAYLDSVIHWFARRQGYAPTREQIVQSDGVVPALHTLVKTYSKAGDGVLLLTPVYYPFYGAITENGRVVVESALVAAGDTYEVDFSDFAAKAQQPNVTLCILSSPHNPVGKVFSESELMRIAKICLDNGVFVICDEIHGDLILPPYRFTSMGTLSDAYRDNCVICTAPSKTFNLAGMKCSNLFIFDAARRARYRDACGYFSLGALAYAACQLAYDSAEPWLDALLAVLAENKATVERFLAERLPMLHVSKLQGTYLMWIDFRGFDMEQEALNTFLTRDALLFLDDGAWFGAGGVGFQRMNIACPKTVLLDALLRLERAWKTKKGET